MRWEGANYCELPAPFNAQIIAQGNRSCASGAHVAFWDAGSLVSPVAKTVRFTLQKAIAKANVRRAERGEKPLTMNTLAIEAGVAATTVSRLARDPDDPKAATALTLELAGKILTVLDCGIEDLLEVTAE